MNEQQLGIDKLTERAAALPAAIQERAAALSDLRDRLEILDATSCTGRVRWRKDGGGQPKMFVGHGVDGVCPIHGRAKPGKRLRSYVGADPEKQAEAQAAIEREEERQQVQAQVDTLSRRLDDLDSDLQRWY